MKLGRLEIIWHANGRLYGEKIARMHLAEGQKIKAIKTLRAHNPGMLLKEALDIVNRWEDCG